MPSTAKPPSRLQGGTHAQGGSEAVSSACGGSADHGHRDERTPCRAYQHGEELSLAGMHRAGSCPTGGCLETSWQVTLLGRGPGERGGALGLAGAQVGTGTAKIYRLLQVVAARPSSIGQAGWAWRRRSNSLSLSVTRCRSCRCCCGRGASFGLFASSRGLWAVDGLRLIRMLLHVA